MDLSAITGTHVCLRQVRDEPIWDALATHNVTHLCGAPIVMSLIIAAGDSVKRKLDHVVEFFTRRAAAATGAGRYETGRV